MVFRSPYSLDLPRDQTLHEFLFKPVSLATFSNAPGDAAATSSRIKEPLFYPAPPESSGRPDARPLSLAEVRDLSYDFAVGLQARAASQGTRKWGRGDVLAIYASNQHDYLAAVLGVLALGASVALCNPSYKPEELGHQLRMVQSRALLTTDASYSNACKAVEHASLDGKEVLKGLDASPEILVFQSDHERSWKQVLDAGRREGQRGREEVSKVTFSPKDDTAVLCFSSGTSGKPKAVRLSHAGLVANIIQATFLLLDRVNPPLLDESGWYAAKPLSDSSLTIRDVGGENGKAIVDAPAHHARRKMQARQSNPLGGEFHLDLLPLFHCYGLLMGFVALHSATPRVILPRFQLELFLSAVQEHKVTFCFVVPPILLALAKSPVVDQYDVSSLTRVASGAASLPAELQRAVEKRLGIKSTDGYGMSEMSPIISMQNLKDLDISPGTVGLLAPCTEALVVDSEGNELGVDQEGELWLRGPQMMQGYLRNDDANKLAFYPSVDDPERFIKTGDVVKINSMGYITITDRLKDVIKYHGFQVSPSELEDHLFRDDRVADCAVSGVPDPEDSSELPWAFVVLAPGVEVQDDQSQKQIEQDILEKVNAKVSASFKKLRGISLLDKLPKSDSGKILKRELKSLAKVSSP